MMKTFAFALLMTLGLLPVHALEVAEGKSGKALDGRKNGILMPGLPAVRLAPIRLTAWVRIFGSNDFNIIAASEPKASPSHWELYTYRGSGALSVFLPGRGGEYRSDRNIADGKWHQVAMELTADRVRLWVDDLAGKPALDRPLPGKRVSPGKSGFALGQLVEGGIGFNGLIDEVALTANGKPLANWSFDGPVKAAEPAAFKIALRPAPQPAVKPAVDNSVRGSGPAGDPTRQTEPDWVDARYAKVKFGPFVSGHIATPKGSTHKGIAIRVGDMGEGTMVFDTDLCVWRAGWTGGFLKTDPARYGLIRALKPDGNMVFSNAPLPGVASEEGSFVDPRNPKSGPLPKGHVRFKGLFVHGKRVVVRYDVRGFQIYDAPWLETDAEGQMHFRRDLRIQKGAQILQVIRLKDPTASIDMLKLTGTKSSVDFGKLIQPGPLQWGAPITTTGIVDKRKTTFAIDTITVPYKNPHNALFFTAGHDFTRNGDCYVATAHGDVWKVTGIDAELKAVKWHRFATGLYQPLGLRVVKDQVYVLGRDQITRLHDYNKDGEADFYEAFNNDLMIGSGGHSYATCLETDPAGNFYFIRCAEDTPHGGVLLKVSADGSKLSLLATGFRNPNGLGVGPNGVITAADQQGTWVPETRLDVIKPGGFYGYMPMHKREVAPTTYDPPLMWVPRVLDNSAGGQVWVPEGKWGSFGSELIHFSYGRCTMMHILRDGPNGGAMPIGGRFLSGACRGRFNPTDGHLYVTGLLGWQTAAIRDGCLQRVRYTGAALQQPIRMKVHANGIRLTFSTALDKKIAEDIESWSAEQWNYKWTATYGSKDWSVKNPAQQGRDAVAIQSTKLLPDGKSVFLKFPVRPVHSMAIQYNLDTAAGKIFKGIFHLTINQAGGAFR